MVAAVETIAILVQAYDDRQHPLLPAAPGEKLSYLTENGVEQAKICCLCSVHAGASGKF